MTGPHGSQRIGAVSPSLLEQLDCPLRVSFSQSVGNRHWPHRKATPAVLGAVAHDTIEAVLRGTEVDRAWVRAIESRRSADVRSLAELPTARRTLLRIRKRLPTLLQVLDEVGPDANLLIEHELETADGQLRGRPDLIAHGSETLVVDFKSGLVEHRSGIRASYRRQLFLYGALVHECLGLSARRLLLFSLRQGLIDVPADLPIMEETAAEARRLRDDFNKRTPGPQPARPSPTTCQFCPHAANCDAFWAAVDENWVSTVGLAVRGSIQTSPEKSAWGQSTLTIEVHDGPLSGHVVQVNGIADDLVTNAIAGDLVAAIDLRPLTDDCSSLGCSTTLARQRVTVC